MPGNVVRPTSELTLMMRPDPRARIAGSTARVMASSPNTFVSNWRRTSGPVGHRAARPPGNRSVCLKLVHRSVSRRHRPA